MPPKNGFTLLEVLVALVVAAALLTIVFSGLDISESRRSIAGDRAVAIRIAERELAARALADHRTGEWQVKEGTLSWTAREAVLMVDRQGRASLDQIAIEVSNSRGQLLVSLERRALRPVRAVP